MRPCSAEQQRLVQMLKESISLMCKSALAYEVELNVEGLLGITLDRRDVLLVNINESFRSVLEQASSQDSLQPSAGQKRGKGGTGDSRRPGEKGGRHVKKRRTKQLSSGDGSQSAQEASDIPANEDGSNRLSSGSEDSGSTSCEPSTNSSEPTEGLQQLSSPCNTQTTGDDRLLPAPFTEASFGTSDFPQHGDPANVNLDNIDVKREVSMDSGDFPAHSNARLGKASGRANAQGAFVNSAPIVQSPACSPTTHTSNSQGTPVFSPSSASTPAVGQDSSQLGLLGGNQTMLASMCMAGQSVFILPEQPEGLQTVWNSPTGGIPTPSSLPPAWSTPSPAAPPVLSQDGAVFPTWPLAPNDPRQASSLVPAWTPPLQLQAQWALPAGNTDSLPQTWTSPVSGGDGAENRKPVEAELESPTLFTCEECEFSTPVKSRYDDHLKDHLAQIQKCSLCNRKCFGDGELTMHMRLAHTKPLECNQCGMKYRSKVGLQRHKLAAHQTVFRYKCQTCDKGFNQRRSLVEHVEKNHQQKVFSCSKGCCNASFDTKAELMQHKCSQCQGLHYLNSQSVE